MGNFGRVVRVALRYYWTVAASVVCALIVAVLWGANISFLYPIVEVVGNQQSLSQWVDKSIAEAETTLAAQRTIAVNLEKQLTTAAAEEKAGMARELRAVKGREQAAHDALTRSQWLKPWIDAYLPRDPFQTLLVIMLAFLAATVVKDFFMVLGSALADRIAQLAVFDIRKEFFRRTLRMELGTFSESGTSDLMSRFTHDVESLAGGLQTLFGRAVREPLKMISCFVLAAFICWQLLVLSLVVVPVAGFLIGILAKTLKRANRKALEEMSSLFTILNETFLGIKVVKAFTMERHERRRFHETSKKVYKKSMRIAIVDAMVNPVTEVMGMVTITLAILFGAYLVISGETHILGIKMSSEPLSLSALMAFYGALAGVSDPARRLSEVFSKLQRASAASDRIYEKLDRTPRVCDPVQARVVGRHHRDLVFENVTFRYSSAQPVLEGINLRIPFGETVAIVGPNGCGKSTLANLIPRFYDPASGSIRMDGVDLRDMRLRDLRSQIGLVNQETLLFDDTVLNNIRYGSPHATRQQVIEAAKQAHAHRFIEQKLEQGYDTVVGQGGGRLSGGQRQRISLARAILRDPAILILDEATSQIDLESEQLIHKVLEQFIRHRTAVIITHRLATLALADRVIVMNAGQIIDLGTHEQLLARCDVYRRLHQMQFKETA